MKQMLMKSAVLVLATLVLIGCATTPKKSPEEMIKGQIDGWIAAVVAQDIEKVGTFYSDKFENPQWGDKAGAIGFLDQAKSSGYLEGIELSTDQLEIKVEGETAKAYPIDIKGTFGSISMELSFAKDGGSWLIVGTEADGI